MTGAGVSPELLLRWDAGISCSFEWNVDGGDVHDAEFMRRTS